MKVTGYSRTSTLLQTQEGVSLDNQQERIAAWAKANGHELAGMYVETGSGGRADNRPELQKAMAEVCKNRGILVVYSLSRFSRSVKDVLTLTEQLERSHAHFCSLSESLDTSSAMGRMVFVLTSAMGAFEREILAERTKDAMAHMRRRHMRVSRKIPFGFELASDGVHLVAVDREQRAIEVMADRRAAGDTLAAICAILTEQGIETKEGGPWRPATVHLILKRRLMSAA